MVTLEDIAKLYIAMFGRAPEGEGLNYWYQQASQNDWDITELATYMYYAALQYEDYAYLADPQKLVESIYENVLGKTYQDDPSGIDYWVNQIKSGIIPPGEVARVIIGTAELQYPDHPATKTLHNRVEVALYTAERIPKFTGDFEAYKNFISIVNDDPLTIQLAERNVNSYWEQVKENAAELAVDIVEENYGSIEAIYFTGFLSRYFQALYKSEGPIDAGFLKISSDSNDNGVKIEFHDFYYDEGASYLQGIIKVTDPNSQNLYNFNIPGFDNSQTSELDSHYFNVDVLQTLVISSDYLTVQFAGGSKISYYDSNSLNKWLDFIQGSEEDIDLHFDFEAQDLVVYVNSMQLNFKELSGYIDSAQSVFEYQGKFVYEGEEYSIKMSGDDYGNFNLEMQDTYGNSLEVHWSDTNGNGVIDQADYLSAVFDGEDITDFLL